MNALLIPAVKALLFVALLWLAYRNLRQSLHEVQVGNWPEIKGRIIKSAVVELGVGSRRGLLGSHAWQLQYSYLVDGQEYRSLPATPFATTTPNNAGMMAERMPIGSPVAIRYNPAKPAESYVATSPAAAKIQLALRILIYSLAISIVFMSIIH